MRTGGARSLAQAICKMVLDRELQGPTDRVLLKRFARRGDESAFAELVSRHGGMVLGVCNRVLHDVHDAEDAMQATFLILARKARSRGWKESIANWLLRAARSGCEVLREAADANRAAQ